MERLGYVANHTKAFRDRPEVLRAFRMLQGAIRSNMRRRLFELASLAASLECRSSYGALAHGQALNGHHLDEETLIDVAHGDDSSLPPEEAVAVAFARKVVCDACHIEAADWEAMRAHGYSDAEVFDLASAASAQSFFSRVLDASLTQPDAVYHRLEPGLRQALTVGRSIE